MEFERQPGQCEQQERDDDRDLPSNELAPGDGGDQQPETERYQQEELEVHPHSLLGPASINVGLIEGGCCNEENVRVLQDFRKHCKVLISVGDCATMGGIPAMRNLVPLEECLQEAYVDGPTVHNPSGLPPGDSELPRLLDRVYALHEVVDIDWHLPGCPPSPEAFWAAVSALLSGEPAELPPSLIRYD